MGRLRILVVGAGVGGISVARGLLRDGHDASVFEQRPDAHAGGGAVTTWSNGETVLAQLGVDMDGAGQLLSTVRVVTSTGRSLVNLDLTAIVDRLGAPVRTVPRAWDRLFPVAGRAVMVTDDGAGLASGLHDETGPCVACQGDGTTVLPCANTGECIGLQESQGGAPHRFRDYAHVCHQVSRGRSRPL